MVKAKLNEAIKTAMRSHDKDRLLVLRTLKSAIRKEEIDRRTDLEDDSVLAILQSQHKQRAQAKEMYLQGERKDLADQEEYELKVIEEFLPKPLTDEELACEVDISVNELSITDMSGMGKIMKHLKEKLGSQADGKRLSAIVRQRLSGK